MKRNEIVESLMKEGFSEKTLVNFSDKQLVTFASRILGESDIMISKKDPLANQKIADAKKQNKSIETYEEEMKEGSKKKKVSKPTIYDKALKDLGGEEGVIKFLETGKKPKKKKEVDEELKGGQKKLDKNHNGKIDAQDFKILKGKKENIKEWVSEVTNKKFHSFTSKNEIMEMIQYKLKEAGPNVKIGHNGTPEFMTYDAAPEPSKPGTDAPVREKPTTKPSKPKRENPFEPKHNPKPKAEGNEGLPEFLKFDNLGIKFKNSK
jgi:hypothetical protein